METTEESSGKAVDLRSNRRMKLKEQQEFNRMKAFDSNRFMESEIFTEKVVSGMCSRIKRRKHATEEDLRKLSNAFIQTEANIMTFMKTTGAINIIIKEFTGGERSQQLLAAQCLCNLSLGDETCCSKVATFAGSYLMIFIMKSSDVLLSRICLWITQNIVAAGSKAMNVLIAQELMKNCLHIASNSADHEAEALQLLDIIVDSKWNELEDHEKQEIQENLWSLLMKGCEDPLLLQVFCKITTFESLNRDETYQILTMMINNLKGVISKEKTDEQLIYFTVKLFLKTMQQDPQNVISMVELLIQQSVKLSDLINEAAGSPKFYSLVKELLQITSSLYTNQHPLAARYFAFDPTENIRITKIFEF